MLVTSTSMGVQESPLCQIISQLADTSTLRGVQE